MEIPIENLTPRQIVAQLNNYIVGQEEAKRAVAIALRNRYRRQKLPKEQREDIIPKNILMIGPTGVGKTEIARRLAQLARAPFIKVEATKFTEVGYVGRDVDSIIRDLVNVSMRLVENEKIEEVRPVAEKRAIDRIVDLLVKPPREFETTTRTEDSFRQAFERVIGATISQPPPPPAEEEPHYEERTHAAYERQKRKVREQIESGARDDELVEIEVEEAHTPFMQVFTPQGMEEMGFDLSAQLANAFGRQTTFRRVPVAEAKVILTEEEARKMIDRSALTRDAIQRAEQTGIVFLDEIDKIAGRESTVGPDVSREGVQRDLLPIIEGSTVVTKYGPVRTDHILFICAGAFNVSKPSDLIPELQGRLPIRVELTDLGEQDLRRILTEPKNALTKQYAQLLAADGVFIEFQEDAIDEIAHMAHEVNLRTENIGARRLHTVMEKLLEDILFEAPDTETKRIVIDAEWVHRKLSDLVKDTDLSKYIL
ncbi:MAG TPA: ATP-dependent protease ATPase subunit HslU [Fimbriimonadales bacterium]|nr:ATP-dependent protease ATPase subunit HslU [Fimbriimonadales bacterium]